VISAMTTRAAPGVVPGVSATASSRAARASAIAETPGTTPGAARVVIAEITDRMVWLEAIAYGPIDADVVALASELRERGLAALAEKGFLAA